MTEDTSSTSDDRLQSLLDYIVAIIPGVDPALLRELLDHIQTGDIPIEIEDRPPIEQEELLELAGNLWQIHEAADVSTDSEDRALVPVATAWWHATFRHAEAACRLVQGGLPDVAVPNARSALEHAVHLSALAQCADAGCAQEYLDASEAEFLRTEHAVMNGFEADDDFGRAEGQLMKQLVDGLPTAAAPEGFEWVKHFEQVCKRLHGGHQLLYSSHRLMSGMSHAGFGSATIYFWGLAEGAPMEPVTRYGETLFTVIASAVWASQALDHLLGTDTSSALATVADRLNVTPLFERPKPQDP